MARQGAHLPSWLVTSETGHAEQQSDLQCIIDLPNGMNEGTLHVGFVCDEHDRWKMTTTMKKIITFTKY